MDTVYFQQKLADIAARHDVPALGFAMKVNGHETILATGLRKRGEDTAVEVTDKFHMGSCGKAVTSLLIRQLMAAGAFRPDSTLEELLPDIAIDPAYKTVTLTDLLTHSAGLPANHDDLGALAALEQKMSPAEIRAGLMKEALETAPAADASRVYHYSNIGYAILGAIAERVTGESYESLVQTRIFDRLGMTGAGFGCAAAPDAVTADQPWSHIRSEDGESHPCLLDNPAVYAPAGTIHAPMGDWLKLLHFIAKTGCGKNEVPSGQAGAFYTDAGLARLDGLYTHDGSNGLNYARVMLLPGIDALIVIVCNDGSAAALAAVDELTHEIVQKGFRPKTPKPAPPSPPAL